MKRRDFLRNSSFATLPVLLGGMGISAVNKPSFLDYISDDNDKILVLIFMNGGNDGLNTIIPMDQYGVLSQLRPQVILPENQLLEIDNNNGLHPVMSGFKNLYDDQKLGIVQGVAYPDQNRSHFRSTDIWQTASDANVVLDSGWLGRYLEINHPDYPSGYPNPENPDPLALTIDYSVSETCQGTAANFSLALANENSISSIPESIQGDITDDCYGDELGFVIESIAQLNQYSERVLSVYDAGSNKSNLYDPGSRLAEQLKLVARLIDGGSQTKVYIIHQGGYDTHAQQVLPNQHEVGNHATLLQTLSDAIEAFQDDIDQLGHTERVLGMTYSEFGRRVRSNFSDGTDHGTAAPMFLFGSCVQGGTLGSNPELDTGIDGQAGVEMQYDFRSVYASVLMDWFGLNESEISTVLYKDFQYLPILKNCLLPVEVQEEKLRLRTVELYPNPASSRVNVEVELPKGIYSVTVYSTLGGLVKNVFHRSLEKGEHQFIIDVSDLISGQYVLRMANQNDVITKRFSVFR